LKCPIKDKSPHNQNKRRSFANDQYQLARASYYGLGEAVIYEADDSGVWGKTPFMVFDDCPDDLDFIAQNLVSNALANQGRGFSGGLEGLAAYTVSTTVLVMT
jgi:hypothetical protein